MKLYTEFEVKFAMDTARCQQDLTFDEVLEQLTPIELPSDEEIDELFPKTNTLYEALGRSGMIEGAKWMRDKIQGGDQ
jgi:hypothetical protein